MIPPIDRSGQAVQHALHRIHGAFRRGVRTREVPVRTQHRHHPRVQELNVRPVLYGIQQVPLVDYAYRVVVVRRELAPPVPEGSVDDAGAVLAVVAVRAVVEVAFLVTGDGGPEHDNVVGLRGRKRRDNGDEESWVGTYKFFDEGGS